MPHKSGEVKEEKREIRKDEERRGEREETHWVTEDE